MPALSQGFAEKVILLLITAATSGFLIPYILKSIDQTKAIEQKRLEADLARQAKTIEAQSKFLDDTTEALWSWRYLSMRVAYNGSEGREDEYAKSVSAYLSGIWDVLSRLRNQTSKSRRLVSKRGYEALVALYDEIAALDGEMDAIIRQELPPAKRAAALKPVHGAIRSKMTQKLDDTLAFLAEEVHLNASQSAPLR
jgi:hypothetical protein